MMNLKKLLAVLLVVAMVAALFVGCNKQEPTTTTGENKTTTQAGNSGETTAPAPESTEAPVPEEEWDGAYIDRDDFRAYTAYDLANAFKGMEGQLSGDVLAAVTAAYEQGDKNINAAQTVDKIRAAYEDAVNAMMDAVPVADGVYSYSKLGYNDRTDLLGIMERYAIQCGLTGISLYENGSYMMYNPRVTLGTENYIVGYGFGTLAEGAITADLAYETNPDWARYYHTFEVDDPGTLNYLNDQGAVVGDLYAYFGGSYFENFMNATKDGYDWVPCLAKEKPVAVDDADGDGMAKTWRFEIHVGDVKYTTGATNADRAAFNNRPVELDDYVAPYRYIMCQSNNLFRGSEAANGTTGAIAGAKEYYAGTENGFNQELWDKVGVKAYEENGKSYFQYTFTDEVSQFYSMYYISSSIFSPRPQAWFDLIGSDDLYGFSRDGKLDPVENSLALGAYYPERYDSDQQIVFKKNPNFVFADTKYSIPGIHVKIFPAQSNDPNAALQEFLAEHFDAVGIPQDYLDEYRNDPRTRTTTGTSNFKLNVNACDQETWEYLFGVDGVVKQNAKEDYWDLKPALGNKHFLHGISLSINRQQFGVSRGAIGSVDWLASNYMSNPEDGISYSTTDAHKKAVEYLLEDTDGYGFNIDLARDYFRLALTELEKDGAYKPGTKENPTVINIEIAWMRPAQEDSMHNEIKQYIEAAFNDESVCGGVYKLSVNFWVGNEWSDVYYNKMMVGQYDIGFGSISGNSLDPLSFLNVLSSDMELSHSFTLNWGVDTNSPDVYPLVYDNVRWSYDALFNAGTTQAIVSEGKNKAALTIDYNNITKNDDGSYTGSFVITPTLPDKTTITVDNVVCCNYERYRNGDGEYAEEAVTFETSESNGAVTVTFTVPAELAADYATGSGTSENPTGVTGFDLYYSYVFDGAENAGQTYSVDDTFVIG